MVDINLFKDEDDENQIPSDEGDNDDLSGALDSEDAFNLDELNDLDDIEETESLDDDVDFQESSLLDDEEIPDLDGTPEEKSEESYDFGASRKKNASLLIWILLAAGVIAVVGYAFLIMPKRQLQPPVVRRPDIAITERDTVETAVPAEEKDDISVIEPAEEPEPILTDRVERPVEPVVDAGEISRYSSASSAVISELARTNQFSSLFLTGSRFFAVEYASETPNVTSQMAHRLQTLLNAKDVKYSPEDRRVTAGRPRYHGVISGELSLDGTAAARGNIQTVSQFQTMLRQQLQQNGFSRVDIQVFPERSYGGQVFEDILVKSEGRRDRLTSLFNALSNAGANVYISKMMVVPSNYSDFSAEQVQLSLEFRVIN